MHTTNLRKVGGSVMLSIPPAMLDLLQIGVGDKVGVAVDKGKLIIEPKLRPHYTLEQLLKQCDNSAQLTDEDRSWLDAKSVGSELL